MTPPSPCLLARFACGCDCSSVSKSAVFSFRRLYVVFRVDEVDVVVYPCTTENKVTVRGIVFAGPRDWVSEQREDDSDNRTFVPTSQREKDVPFNRSFLPPSFVKSV